MNVIFFVFIFFYPLFMAVYWMTGALIFFNRRERNRSKPPKLDHYPHVSILVPCHNEQNCIHDAIRQLAANRYPSFDIIAINDGSTDNTGKILKSLSEEFEQLKVVTLTKNYGKAMALNAGVLASKADYIMCIDADALLDKDALFWMIKHFIDSPRVAAVTGNPRVINKTSLLSRIQIGEFSAIVGMVKRTQRNIGRLFTISGVTACFRKSALHDVGYWSAETVTEDIDISWKLQLRYWDIRYEPKALTWILVPETLQSLWKQRLRWAQGGFEASIKFGKEIFQWKNRRMWVVNLEYWVSVLWCYAITFTIICWVATHTVPEAYWPDALIVATLIPKWTGVALAVVCLAQFSIGLLLDGLYERRGLLRYLFWAIWYPAFYWLLSAATTVIAVPKGLIKMGKTRHAVWISPGRKLLYAPLRIRETRHQSEHRQFFWRLVPNTKKYAELMVTFISWSLWVYLITPLISLGLWFAGGYLFKKEMLSPGSVETFTTALNYGSVIVTMWLLTAAWIIWNSRRYGRRNRRNSKAPVVTTKQVCESTKLTPESVDCLRSNKETYLHFDDDDHPIIDHNVKQLNQRKVAANL
ncbi:MAG: poly-beta-1,6 N-acetyl-D-glucosamine synthase [Gammaproteobacteria bacterium]|nr:poly-beta-1,6 N-acetyl-D-glucosamine synthase [Gammaproteobacteria bacterium]